MPLYRVRCPDCGAEEELYRSLKEYNALPAHCGDRAMERVICPPMVVADISPYRSMIDGSWITSRSQHRDHLRAHGCREVGNDIPKDSSLKPLSPPPGLKDTIIGVANEKLRG